VRRRLVVAVACFLIALVVGSAGATTDTLGDPQGDVLACSGECNQNGEDLQSVTVDDAGGTLTFTIKQYDGDLSDMCGCFYPQVQIYVGSTDPRQPDFYTATWNIPSSYSGSGVGLFDYAQAQVSPCASGGTGGADGQGLVADVDLATPNQHTIKLAFPASAIPSSTFRWRIAEPAASRCEIEGNPESTPRDVAPDGALRSFTVAPTETTGGGDRGRAPSAPPAFPAAQLFRQVLGVRLRMTVPQATHAIPDTGCPMLTATTRRDRSRYPCWFTRAALPPGGVPHESELIWGSNARRCGADATLLSGRVLDIGTGCKVKLANGAGVGSSFKQLYAAFPAGTVHCFKGGQFNHQCRAQQRSGRAIYYTEFNDGKPIDNAPQLKVSWLQVGKCAIVASQPNWHHTPDPCDARFLQAHPYHSFTP
jgi:hypothetical protein